MNQKDFNEMLRNPAAKKLIHGYVEEVIKLRESKENANSKQAAKREKRG
jgi:hypothetical protein